MKKKEVKKTKKKGPMMVLIALIVIVLIGVIGYLVLNSLNVPVGTLFGKIFGVNAPETNDYYEYIKKYEDDKYFEDNPYIWLEGFKINDIEKKVVAEKHYNKDGDFVTTLYYYKEDKVIEKTYNHASEIRPLYNIDKEEYGFWLIEKTNGNIIYTLLDDIVKENNKPYKFTFKSKENYSSKDSSGKTTRIAPIDEHFITYTNLSSIEEISKDNKDNIKKYLNKTLNDAPDANETGDDDYARKQVKEALETLKKQQAEVKSYQSTIKVGSYTLKLGTYKGSMMNAMGKYYTVKVVLKKNKINVDGKDESYSIRGRYILVHGFEMFEVKKNNEIVYLAQNTATLKYQG